MRAGCTPWGRVCADATAQPEGGQGGSEVCRLKAPVTPLWRLTRRNMADKTHTRSSEILQSVTASRLIRLHHVRHTFASNNSPERLRVAAMRFLSNSETGSRRGRNKPNAFTAAPEQTTGLPAL